MIVLVEGFRAALHMISRIENSWQGPDTFGLPTIFFNLFYIALFPIHASRVIRIRREQSTKAQVFSFPRPCVICLHSQSLIPSELQPRPTPT